MSDTVTEISVDELPEMQRDVNRGLMVHFINADLLNRASLDVQRSIVFYDASKIFAYATDSLPDNATLQRLAATTSVRFWSRGC